MASLRLSIEAGWDDSKGCPVATEDGRLLDGHNRLAVKPDAPVAVVPGSAAWSDDECRAYVFRLNRERRNLSPSQKAEVRKREVETAKRLRKENAQWFTQERLGQMFGVSRESISDWVAEDTSNGSTTNTCTPDSRVKVPPQSHEVIYRRALAGEPQAQIAADYGVTQQQVSSICGKVKREKEKRSAVEAILKAIDPAQQGVILGDFRVEGACVNDDSVQLVFTDPPYGQGAVGLYGDLSAFAARVLVPGGLCLAYAGQSFLPEVYVALSEHLEYVWTFAVRHVGGDLRFRKWNLQNGWKPVLCFGKPPLKAWWEWFPDVASGGREKGTHPWQQAVGEAEHFLAALTTPDGLVCDPFCGGGTTCLAARNLGRRYVAFELDEAAAREAAARLVAAEKGTVDA